MQNMFYLYAMWFSSEARAGPLMSPRGSTLEHWNFSEVTQSPGGRGRAISLQPSSFLSAPLSVISKWKEGVGEGERGEVGRKATLGCKSLFLFHFLPLNPALSGSCGTGPFSAQGPGLQVFNPHPQRLVTPPYLEFTAPCATFCCIPKAF